MGNGYKAFRGIIRDINRNRREREYQENMDYKAKELPALEKFAEFIDKYSYLDGDRAEKVSGADEEVHLKEMFQQLGEKALKELGKFMKVYHFEVSFDPVKNTSGGELTLRLTFSHKKEAYLKISREQNTEGIKCTAFYYGNGRKESLVRWISYDQLHNPTGIRQFAYRVADQLEAHFEGGSGIEAGQNETGAGQQTTGSADSTEETHLTTPLNAEDKVVWEEINQTVEASIKQENYFKAAEVLYKLLQDIRMGTRISLLPNLILALKTPKLKSQGFRFDLYELLETKPFIDGLSVDLFTLIPKELKDAKAPKKVDWKADPKDPGLMSILKPFPVAKENSSAFDGAYFTADGIMASDGMKLLFINAVYPGEKGPYCIHNDCFKLHREAGVIATNAAVPDYKALVKELPPLRYAVSLTLLYQFACALIDSGLRSKERNACCIRFNDDQFVGLDTYFLKTCCEALLKLGVEKIEMGFSTARRAIFFYPFGQAESLATLSCSFCILMPCLLKSEKDEEAKAFNDLTKGTFFFDVHTGQGGTAGLQSAPEAILKNGPKKTIEKESAGPEEKPIKAAPAVAPAIHSSNPLVDDAWFKQHPEKVLGEVYMGTRRFGRPEEKVRGTMDNVLKGISFSPRAEAIHQLIQPKKYYTTHSMKSEDTSKNITNAINHAKKEIAQRAVAKATRGKDAEIMDLNARLEFDQVLKQYNENITEDEIRAWIWFKRVNKGFNDERVILNKSNGWSNYVVPLADIQNYLPKWIKSGVVCYFEGSFMPSVLYYAENIYLRQAILLKEKNIIVSKFGIEQFDRQWQGLEAVKPAKLTLTDPKLENRLFIKPDSEFARSTIIHELADGSTFTKTKGSSISNDGESLKEAFKSWLEKLPSAEFKKSTSFDIIRLYLRHGNPSNRFDKEEKLRLIQNAKIEGDKFFAKFLAEGISREDQLKIEQLWNSKYNGYVEVDYYKIPVGFTCSATFKNKPLYIRKEQRQALGFVSVRGSGCIAYDVGLGKTMTAILSVAQAIEMGQCKRPLIIVPNQTYKNWLKEIGGVREGKSVILTGLLPQYEINDLYNLGEDYIDKLRDKSGRVQMVAPNTITVMTYEGFNRLSFDEDTWDSIGKELFDILNQGYEKDREQQQLYERIEEMMGKGLRGGMLNIEDLGFDQFVVDEAHSMKKSFTKVKGEQKQGEEGREKSEYSIQSGQPSMTALRGFMISQYIQRQNHMRNVLLLTATPFTNSPLEIYSMLSLIGYKQLVESGIRNLKDFFDTFIKTSLELVIDARLKPVRKEVVMGFHNLIALQQLIFRFITYKTGEDVAIQRPHKVVLPMQHKMEDGHLLMLPQDQQISTNLSMTNQQKKFMADVESYVLGHAKLEDFCINPHGLEDHEEGEEEKGKGGELLIETNLDSEEQEGTRILRGLSFARQLALSPYLYGCNPDHDPSYKEYIETSPKLKYVMECIRTVKHYHEERGEEVSGQVIYMNAGVHFFPLIRQYLIEEIGYKENEVGIIRSGMSNSKKEGVKEGFLAGDVKIIIGSATIKEGINLQERSTVLYNCWLDWNPTDIKQLEGRIWRYGNVYANVRIVNPLMENSIDTFIFQKLQEKTSRINEIWFRAGKTNTLNLEEFNPAELKVGLVTDPHALAELLLLEDREHIQDEITSLNNQKQMLADIGQQRDIFNKDFAHITTVVDHYKPSENKSRTVETVFKIFKEYLEDEYSGHSYEDQAIYDGVRKAHAYTKRALEQILAPRGLDLNFNVQKLTSDLAADISLKEKTKELISGPKAVQTKAQEIIQQRIQSGYKQRTVMERVNEFADLNKALLSEKMVYVQSPEAQQKQKQHGLKGAALQESSDRLQKIIDAREAFVRIRKRLERLDDLRNSA